MFDNLFGLELPLAARFFIAFVVVLALIAVTFWLIRRFGGERVGAGQARGRQPRLAVIDAAAVDSRRRVVLIRRDNVEHLVMIGGPSDLVIEQNIVRAVPVAPARDAPPPRGPGETVARGTDMVRDVPPARGAAPDTSWAPPPVADGMRSRSEPASRSIEGSRALPDSISPSRGGGMPEPRQPSSRPPLDLPPVEVRQSPPTADVNLADMAQRLEAALRRPAQQPPTPRAEVPPPPPRPAPSREPQARAAPPPRPAPPAEPSPQPAAPRPPQARAAPAAEQPQAPSRPAPAPNAEPQRAPESLRAEPAPPPPQASQPPPAEPPSAVPAAAPRAPSPEPAANKPPPSRSVFDSLEEEMASLLGKPADKP